MQFVNAVYLAKLFNFTIVLPTQILTRKSMKLTDITGLDDTSTVTSFVPLDRLYNTPLLRERLWTECGVRSIMETEINDVFRVHVFKSIDRFIDYNELVSELQLFSAFLPIVLDVDNLLLTIMTGDCEVHKELFGIMKLISSSYSEPITQIGEALQAKLASISNSYNAVHLRIEEDAMKVWKGSKLISESWPRMLKEQKFQKDVPLFIATGLPDPLISPLFNNIVTKHTLIEGADSSTYELFKLYVRLFLI
jgi:hypothetical protein